MSWELLLLTRIIVVNVVTGILTKKICGIPGRARRLLWMFSFSAVFALLLLLYRSELPALNGIALLIVGLGIINSLTAYSQWRAYDISLSKASLCSPLSTVVALLLGLVFLGETQYFSGLLLSGVALSLLCSFLLVIPRSTATLAVEKEALRSFLVWIALATVLAGLITFSMRYLSYLEAFPAASFIFYWYLGSIIGGTVVVCLSRGEEKSASLSAGDIVLMLFLSMLAFWGRMLDYWIFGMAPISVAQPILQFASTLAYMLIGLFVFKEVAGLRAGDRIAIVAGMAGAILISFSQS